MNCIYCKQNICGLYLRDDYGHCAHENHAIQCFSCGQFITIKDIKLADGRPLCLRCSKMAVVEDSHIEWVRNKVLGMYRKINLSDIRADIPIELIDYKQMLKLRRNPSFCSAHQYGLTISSSSSFVNRTKWEHKIYMLNHLHRVAFAGILAHELFHVWQNEKMLNLSPALCEGLCNLGSYLMFGQIEHEISRVLSHQMEISPDPIYGNGFRIVKAIYDHNESNIQASLKDIVKLNHNS